MAVSKKQVLFFLIFATGFIFFCVSLFGLYTPLYKKRKNSEPVLCNVISRSWNKKIEFTIGFSCYPGTEYQGNSDFNTFQQGTVEGTEVSNYADGANYTFYYYEKDSDFYLEFPDFNKGAIISLSVISAIILYPVLGFLFGYYLPKLISKCNAKSKCCTRKRRRQVVPSSLSKTKKTQDPFSDVLADEITLSPINFEVVDIKSYLRNAMQLEEFSDITFILGDDEFLGHKIILSQRCNFFKRYFQEHSGVTEMEFPEYTYDVFHKFMEWIYCGSVEIPSSMFQNMIQMAERFSATSFQQILVQNSSEQNSQKPIKLSEPIGGEFSQAVGQELFSDIAFIVEGKTIAAHKIILASRSDYYRAVFLSGMRESRETELIVPDITYATFNDILQFLYSGEILITDETDVISLLVAADELAIDPLKSRCESVISVNIDLGNCLDLLQFSDIYFAHQLKEHVIHFILKNIQKVKKTPEFSKLDSELLAEIELKAKSKTN